MNNHTEIVDWATECLTSKEYSLINIPEIVVKTPWSTVIRFSTTRGAFYLKQAPPAISIEPGIMQHLARLHASVPEVIAINDDLHCFLMRDAGLTLREYLKPNFKSDLMCKAIKAYSAIQRLTENHCETFFKLGVPDWRLDKFPIFYNNIINQSDFLKADGVTDQELQILFDLSSQFSAQCEQLVQYQIPETVAIYDFNTNNMLIEPTTHKMTLIDVGEMVITHPFLSLHTFLFQATVHHPVKALDQTYGQLQDACLVNWFNVAKKDELETAFALAKKLWPIYSVFSICRLIDIIGLDAFKTVYANRPNRIAGFLREYYRK